jgi:acyl-CoA reductase-like NAD-dependent aldehyde dehydrogenase
MLVVSHIRPSYAGMTSVTDIELAQISGSSAVQCYCPATGQLLGVINPSTPDGIDRAVARAQEAQRTWALTTFSQRRKVLKTLLK